MPSGWDLGERAGGEREVREVRCRREVGRVMINHVAWFYLIYKHDLGQVAVGSYFGIDVPTDSRSLLPIPGVTFCLIFLSKDQFSDDAV